MSALPIVELLERWKQENIEQEKVTGHVLQHLWALYAGQEEVVTSFYHLKVQLKEVMAMQKSIVGYQAQILAKQADLEVRLVALEESLA